MWIPRTTLEQWRVLQAIVAHGGYAQAALALHKSQSSISYMAARLQEQAGVELLVIEGRKARLTENGRILLARASELLADAQKLEHLAGSLEKGWEAEVRLVTDVAFPTPLLLQALRHFTGLAAQTRVQLNEVVLSGADEALLDERNDLVIGTRVPPGYLGNHLLDVAFIAVAHPEHALHRLERELDAEDLQGEIQVVLRDSGTLHPRDEGWLGATQRWTVTSLHTSIAMVAGGVGFAWLPHHLILDELAQGQLRALPLSTGKTRQVSLYLMFGSAENAGPATRQLAQVLEEAAAAYAPPSPATSASVR